MRGLSESCISDATARGDPGSYGNTGERKHVAAAVVAGGAARRGACVRTGGGADLCSAARRHACDSDTECKGKAARDRASWNNGCASHQIGAGARHQLEAGCATRKTTE